MTRVLMTLAGLLAAASSASAGGRRVPVGQWGGPHARLEVHEKGATLELDCARGTIEEPMRLARAGRFEARGTFQPEGGALPTQEETPAGRPARYAGSLKGKVLSVTITTEDGRDVGPFELQHGATAQLVKCQ
jgi:hypothetical protein